MREPSGWCPALILLMAVTVGCVSRVPAPYLVKNVTEQQVAADDFECRKESTVGTESSFAFGHPIILLGWWIHVRNVTVRAENEATRLWGLCMKARGYHPEGGVGEVAISRQAPISETQKSFAAAADELHSILPTSPFCALPGYSAPDLTILRMSTHTSLQGF